MGDGEVVLSGGDVAGMRQSRRIVKLVKVAGVPVLSMIVWTAVVGYGVLAGWWHRALAPAGDTPAFMAAARQMMSSSRTANDDLDYVADQWAAGRARRTSARTIASRVACARPRADGSSLARVTIALCRGHSSCRFVSRPFDQSVTH